ncbi:MAG: UDP-N-acetylglucosamine 2-epimerase (hydrolyzing) [Candidatus Omnitrophica bacterium]|nr:UDP-N-acetylglucosamine 2-epimerase (hydrolyzing) [Candidatus Omnitrophota bacterium]
MSKRKICVVTGSRAEYGHLYWLLRAIEDDPALELQTVVTGMHLSSDFGSTVNVIKNDGFQISGKVKVLSSSGKDEEMTRPIGRGLNGFTDIFKKLSPDIVVVLGDRFEVFSAAIAAYILQIPVAHIHGGELTEGALDEGFRHSITKMASIHFPAAKDYADRIIRMGELPRRVFAFGAPGLDSIRGLNLLTKKELEESLGLKMESPTAVVTYHPVTLERGTASAQMDELVSALDEFDMRIIFTMPNADTGHKVITGKIRKYAEKNKKRVKVFTSLGQIRYLSLLKHADLMIGNSSSGIVEAPSLKLPVVNIGDRQKGRIKPGNVIDCGYSSREIKKAVKKALSSTFIGSLAKLKNPYGKGNVSVRIKDRLKKVKLGEELIKKEFFDG